MNVVPTPELAIGVPLAAAAVLVLGLDRFPRRAAQWFAIAVAATTWGATLVLLARVLHAGTIVSWVGGWHPGNRVGLGIALAVDPAAACVAALVATTVLAAIVFSYEYFEDVGAIFYVLVLAMLGAMIGFTYAADLFDIFVWYEVFSVAAYALASYRTESESAYAGALQFALTNSVAGLFFLVGISLLEGRTGELNLVSIGRSLAAHPHGDALVATSLAFVAIGLFTRGALAPLHFWFDEVHAAAPAPLCAILSGAMVPLALYGFARIYWTTYAASLPPSHALVTIFTTIGVLSALYGTAMTLRESRLKRKLAHATVAHSGVALAAIAACTPRALAGAAIYEASFALAAGALFFAVAILRSLTGEIDVMRLRGAGRALPLTGLAFGIATLVPCGLAPGMRAVAESGTLRGHLVLAALAIVVAAGTGGALFAAFVRIFVEAPYVAKVRRYARPWFLVGASLALATIALGLAFTPAATQGAAFAAASLADAHAYGRAVLGGARVADVVVAVPIAGFASLVAPLGALLVAGVILARTPAARRIRIALARNPLMRVFRGLDDGDSGVYIAWIAGSATALTLALVTFG